MHLLSAFAEAGMGHCFAQDELLLATAMTWGLQPIPLESHSPTVEAQQTGTLSLHTPSRDIQICHRHDEMNTWLCRSRTDLQTA